MATKKRPKQWLAIPISLLLFFSFFSFQHSDQNNANNQDRSSFQLEQDTTEARRWVQIAEAFQDSARYDSALVYYKKAKVLYRPYLEENKDTILWKVYLQCGNQIGVIYRKVADYKKSLDELETTLEQGKNNLGESHPIVGDSYNNIGGIYIFQRNYKLALENFQKALRIRINALGEKHADVGSSYSNIGNVYWSQGAYEAALGNFQKALRIQINILGENHPTIAINYTNIGNVYLDQGAYEAALKNYQMALKIRINTLSENHPEIAMSYSGIGNVYFNQASYEAALENYQMALKIRVNALGENHPDVGAIYNKLGNVYWSQGAFETGLENYQRALKIQLNNFGEDHSQVATSYSNIGSVFWRQGFYEEALENLQKALKIRINILGKKNPNVGVDYTNIGIIYKNQGAFEEALENHKKALQIFINALGESNPVILSNYLGIGNIYLDQGKPQVALLNFKKALKIGINAYGEMHPNISYSYNNIGNAYRSQGDYELALENYQKALKISINIFGGNHHSVASNYNNIGNAYFDQGNDVAALENYQKALTIGLNTFGENHPNVAMWYDNIGGIYKNQGAYKLALENYQKALVAYTTDFKKLDIKVNPTLNNEFLSDIGVLKTLQKKAETLFSFHTTKTSDKTNLLLSHQTYQLAMGLIDHIRRGYKRQGNKKELLKNAFPIYEGAIQTNLALYQATKQDSFLQHAYTAFEKSRSILLLEDMQSANAKSFAGISDKLLSKDQELSIRLAFYEKQLFEEKLKKETADNDKIARWQNEVFQLRQTYDSITQVLEAQYPDYYRLKYDISVISLQDAQSLLTDELAPDQTDGEESVLLEYFVGDSMIYVFIIDNHDFQCIEIQKDFPLEEWVKQLHNSIYAYHISPHQGESLYQNLTDTLLNISHQLYQKLIAGVADHYRLPKKIIISPDGILGYLPFEILLKKLPEDPYTFHNHAWLLKDHQISYTFSATLLKEMQEKQLPKTRGDFIAFAPLFEEKKAVVENEEIAALRSGLAPLKYNIPESEAIQQLLGGKVFAGVSATEATFVDQAAGYKIIHLATHGKANDKMGDYAYLAFAEIPDSIENEKLYNRDLYNLRLNADMVTLSACETGIGELQRGEGIISLARGFSYAGTKSLITSLWSVDDASTKELMEGFYRYIKAGKAKDEALHLAKLDYLDNHRTINAHPFYWASFIAMGDMTPIDLGPSISPLWWVLIGVVVVVVFLIWRKRRSKSLQGPVFS